MEMIRIKTAVMQQAKVDIDNERFKSYIEQSHEGFAIHNEQGIFTYVNSAMAAMYGYAATEILGQSWQMLVCSTQAKEIENDYFPILFDRGYWHGYLQGRRKDGQPVEIDLSITVLTEKGSKNAGLLYRTSIAENKHTQLELLKHQRQYELVLDHSPILIAHIDNDGCYKLVNKEYCEWKGVSSDIIGQPIEKHMSEAAYSLVKPNIDKALNGEKVCFEVKVPRANGAAKWVHATYVPIHETNEEVTGFYAFIIDINDRKEKEFEHARLIDAIENGIEGFSIHNKNGDFTYVNAAEANMYGYHSNEILGKNWKILYDDQQIKDIENIYFPMLIEQGHWQGELKGLTKNGAYFDVEVSLNTILDEEGNINGLFCACRDISERKSSQELVDFLAYHDALTGLPNRVLFNEHLEQSLNHAQQHNKLVAVLFIDLDFFKDVNDTFGHSVGDELLKNVAGRLNTIFREQDMIARLSGDEFTVLLTELSDQRYVTPVLEKLVASFHSPIQLDAHTFHQTISVGVSFYPTDGTDVETLMKNADTAMYRAKDIGRQCYSLYTANMSDSPHESILYRGQLQAALEKDEFVLHYQPLVSFQENKIIGFEALIRWQHPELGLIYPDKFISFAEESNLIIPMGYWVLEKVCQQLKIWRGILSTEHIAINVSGIQIQSDFAHNIAEVLNTNHTNTAQIELEITETFLMNGFAQSVSQLEQLRELGLSLSIDDFGTGYSSLSQLKHLPIHNLKIDRSFVGNIIDDPDDLAIVEAIIAMGKKLKLQITAEGVETAEQHALLHKIGCHTAQGYYYARPVPAIQIPATLSEINARLKKPK